MRIMIVDDNVDICDVLYHTLGKDHEVSVFVTVEDALSNLLDSADFDLIITDICMPKVDGHLFNRIIKQKFPSITVAFMSGSKEELDKTEGIKILKPFNGERIRRDINKL